MTSEFTSSELSRVAEEAPQNTLAEDIEAICQRDIAAHQVTFFRHIHLLISNSDRLIEHAIQHETCDKKRAHDLVWKRIDQSSERLRNELNKKIADCHLLRDSRFAALKESTQ